MIFSWIQVAVFLLAMVWAGWLLFPDEYMQGRMYRDRTDRSESIALYQSFLSKHPGHKGAVMGLAASCEAAGVPEEAVEPMLEFYRMRRGDLESGRAAVALLERSRQTARAEDFRWELIEDLRVQPPAGRKRLEEVLFEALQRAVAAQDDERALKAMSVLSGLSADAEAYREQMIRLLLARRLLDRALALMREQVRPLPTNVELRRMVVRVQLARGDERAALAEIESALGVLPFNARLLGDRAHIHLEAKRWDKAESDLRLLTRIESQEEGWPRDLARCIVESGRIEEGVALYESLLAKKPTDQQTWWDLVYVFADRDRHEEAAVRLERFRRLNPADTKILDALVSERRAGGRVDLAIALLQKRVKEAPADADRRETLIGLLVDEERLEEASVQIEGLLALSPNNPKTWLEAAYLRQTLNDYPGAISLYERYLARFPDDSVSIEKLASLYATVGERRKAIDLLKRYFLPLPPVAPPRAGGPR